MANTTAPRAARARGNPWAMRSITSGRTTAGGTAFFLGEAYSDFGLQVTQSSGSVLAKVTLQGSLTGSNWTTLTGSTWVNYATGTIVWYSGKACTYIRALQSVLPASTANKTNAWIAAAP